MAWLLLVFLFNPAFARSSCEPVMLDKIQAFQERVAELDRRGFQSLTAAYHQDKIKVKPTTFGLPVKLYGDEIQVQVAPQGQLGLWQVAITLFEYQAREEMKKTKSVWLDMTTSEEARNKPILEGIEKRETELYRLLDQLAELKGEDVLPSDDSARAWFQRQGFRLNLKSYLGRDQRGLKLAIGLYLKRLTRALMVAVTLWNVAHIPQTYDAVEVVIQRQALTPLERQDLHQRDMLIKGLNYQLSQAAPNSQLIEEMRGTLKVLHDKHPALIEAP